MTRMARPTLAALVTVISLSVTACGANTSDSAAPTTTVSPSTPAAQADAPVVGGDRLTVSETPWWQQDIATPSATPSTAPAAPRHYVLDGGVLFGPDNADLTLGAASQLRALLDQVVDPTAAQFTVDGFVNDDGTGDPTTAQALSTARALAVQAWLVDSGVPPEHVTVHGWGADRPVYPTPTDDRQRAANRRCEITVTYG